MITIKDLNFSYAKNELILDKLCWEIETSNIHGLVGLNGAGKTTLFHIMYGFYKESKNSILYKKLPLSKKDISLLETENFFYSKITGLEYLRIFSVNNSSFNINLWNDIFNLPLKKYISTYSSGMKKKLAFLGNLALDRSIMLLDEPFNGVDIETVQKLKLIIKKLKEKGKTIIISSHILETLTSICDTISYIEDKKVKFKAFKDNDGFKNIETKIFDVFDKTNEDKINSALT
ncbi:MAG: ATP-binding cassette domain-containing protein [Bacteroidetes bacterium]|nr:ATP-binding cassette domain-containing protein [Bacteroidota bacterium]